MTVCASSVGAGAEDGELEAAGELATNVVLAQVVTGVECAENHFLADSSLEVVLDGFGEGERFRLDGGDSHGVVGLTGVSIGVNANLVQGIRPETRLAQLIADHPYKRRASSACVPL